MTNQDEATTPSPAADMAPAAQTRDRGFAKVSFVFGLIGLVTAVIPYVAFIAWLFTGTAVVTAIMAITRREARRGLAISGLILGIIAWVIAIIVGIISLGMVGAASESFRAGVADGTKQGSVASSSAAPVKKSAPIQTAAPAAPQAQDFAAYSALSDSDFALLMKDPKGHAGEKHLLFGTITQFDSATGKCAFRADTSNAKQTDNSGYSKNTVLFGGDAKSNCPLLSPIVSGDTVEMWTIDRGSYSYDNVNGGSTVVPLFEVTKIATQ